MNLQDFFDRSQLKDNQSVRAEPGYAFKYSNSSGEVFIINAQDIADFIKFFRDNFQEAKDAWKIIPTRSSQFEQYEEKSYRAIFDLARREDHLRTISSTARSQTLPITRVVSKFICYLSGIEYADVKVNSHFDLNSLNAALQNMPQKIENLDRRVKKVIKPTEKDVRTVCLPKPFLLLAGISGTGKTRFVRQQAGYTQSLNETYCLVPVRPDWHEPSDLLGYVSRLGVHGPRYVVSDILTFIVSAWKEIISSIEFVNGEPEWIGREQSYPVRPFWLCLDEMNLAPVEQYFADFLSVLETRNFLGEEELQHHNAKTRVNRSYVYTCDPILKPSVITQLDSDGQNILRSELGLNGAEFNGHWRYFCHHGIALPFNLIVAGTVNMDETTHGFSRKVIDRALTIDFGQFFPNNFDQFFDPQYRPVALGYPMISSVTLDDLAPVPVDPDGARSVEFLAGINNILKGTAFELAYRALNELLLSVVCFAPPDDKTLYAVWDDFLMMKLLPRIEGDHEKLTVFQPQSPDDDDSQDLLASLFRHLESSMAPIWSGDRPDLLRESVNGDAEARTKCRTKEKIEWMRGRLVSHGFTSFWP